MPKVKHNGKTYTVKWSEESTSILFNVEKNFKKNKYIDWNAAECAGALKGLPNIPVKQLSKRLTNVKMMAKPGHTEQANAYWRGLDTKTRSCIYSKYSKNRMLVLNEINKVGDFKRKRIWSDEQVELLMTVVADYKSTSIDWDKLILDKRVRKFPERYRENSRAICKYYWSCVEKSKPENVLKARGRAKVYKKKYYKKSLKGQYSRCKAYRAAATKVLSELVEIR